MRWISTHGNPILDENGRVLSIIGVSVDATEAKHSQLRNRRFSDRLATSMDVISDALFMLDSKWRFSYVNREAEKQFQRGRTELIGKVFWEEFPDTIGSISEQSYREARRLMKTIEFERHNVPLQKWFSARVYPDDEGIAVYFRDVTDAKHAEEEMRRHALRLQGMSRRLFRAQEEEQRRLGRELHDQTGSNLTAMTLSLELLRKRLPGSGEGEMAVWFSDFNALLRETIGHVRTVLSDLRPAALDELGLLAALRHYVKRTLGLKNIALLIEGSEPVPRLAPDVAIELFRVAQEAITNVVKHADAHVVTISLHQEPTCLRLTVKDNGRGFSRSGTLGSGLGLTTMQERVESIGASLCIRSNPGIGTEVDIELPAAAKPSLLVESTNSEP